MRYNTLFAVVKNIEADSPAEAVSKLRKELSDAGFEPYEQLEDLLPDNYQLAFVSEE